MIREHQRSPQCHVQTGGAALRPQSIGRAAQAREPAGIVPEAGAHGDFHIPVLEPGIRPHVPLRLQNAVIAAASGQPVVGQDQHSDREGDPVLVECEGEIHRTAGLPVQIAQGANGVLTRAVDILRRQPAQPFDQVRVGQGAEENVPDHRGVQFMPHGIGLPLR